MKAEEIRKKYIEFFKASPRNHKEIPPSPLVLEGDSTTLFTSAGMQQLTPYLSGKKHPKGKRLVDSQPSLRTQDIDKVGNLSHTTFFEMLGNWSLGDYFKEEQLAWFLEFLTEELKLSKEKLWVSVFKGNNQVPRDEESFEAWKKLGIPEKRIRQYGVNENWWSMTGAPSEMSQGDIGGPDSEVFFEFSQVKHNTKYGKECHPNCQCGRFLEIGNSVFIEYVKSQDELLEELPQKNVDFGGGLERLTAAVINDPDVFQVDLFAPLVRTIEKELDVEYGKTPEGDRSMRVIADHLRASVMLISEGVLPSNKHQGYVLRRLIRRSIFHSYLLESQELTGASISLIAQDVLQSYPNVSGEWPKIRRVLSDEADRFSDALDRGLKKLKGTLEKNQKIDGKLAFDLYQTDGFPLELTLEILKKYGKSFKNKEREEFEKEFEKHKEKSRTASAGMFKGGLADHSGEVIKLHTATHLLHWALREVLGKGIRQEGSNITKERLRFDFSHKQKLTEEEVKKVEKLINEKVKENLPVHRSVEDKDKALKSGALAFFRETYPEKVSVYTIGKDTKGDWISKEVCGGPHVKSTGEIGRVRIKKQDKIGSGLIRIYAVIEK